MCGVRGCVVGVSQNKYNVIIYIHIVWLKNSHEELTFMYCIYNVYIINILDMHMTAYSLHLY